MPIDFSKPKPETLETAIDQVVAGMNSQEQRLLREYGPEAFHHSVGLDLRNEWRLWHKQGALADHFIERFGLDHADDMSGMILRGAFCAITGEAYDPDAIAASYKAHWVNLTKGN